MSRAGTDIIETREAFDGLADIDMTSPRMDMH